MFKGRLKSTFKSYWRACLRVSFECSVYNATFLIGIRLGGKGERKTGGGGVVVVVVVVVAAVVVVGGGVVREETGGGYEKSNISEKLDLSW